MFRANENSNAIAGNLQQLCGPVKFTMRNTSKSKREFSVEADAARFSLPGVTPTFHFVLDDSAAGGMTQEARNKLEEELEKLEHKLRIADRKKKVHL